MVKPRVGIVGIPAIVNVALTKLQIIPGAPKLRIQPVLGSHTWSNAQTLDPTLQIQPLLGRAELPEATVVFVFDLDRIPDADNRRLTRANRQRGGGVDRGCRLVRHGLLIPRTHPQVVGRCRLQLGQGVFLGQVSRGQVGGNRVQQGRVGAILDPAHCDLFRSPVHMQGRLTGSNSFHCIDPGSSQVQRTAAIFWHDRIGHIEEIIHLQADRVGGAQSRPSHKGAGRIDDQVRSSGGWSAEVHSIRGVAELPDVGQDIASNPQLETLEIAGTSNPDRHGRADLHCTAPDAAHCPDLHIPAHRRVLSKITHPVPGAVGGLKAPRDSHLIEDIGQGDLNVHVRIADELHQGRQWRHCQGTE